MLMICSSILYRIDKHYESEYSSMIRFPCVMLTCVNLLKPGLIFK